MAVTKILAKRARLDICVKYAINGDKTEHGILTAYHNCTPLNPFLQMKLSKEKYGKTDGVQCYHIIQSFKPGEIQPEQALEIAKQFAAEHLKGFEAVIGIHIDKDHVHGHIVFNSVSRADGRKYHSTPQSYFEQIRGVSDRLCREQGLSVIMHGESTQPLSYFEWLKKQKGETTLQGMLFKDIRLSIECAGDYGHFLVLMEHMGYEIKHGKHLAFRLRGTENFIRPGRQDALFTEDGIRAAIIGSIEAAPQSIHAAPMYKPFVPFKNKGKLKGFMALYVHYLYLLGKIKKQEYPPRMTPRLKQEILKFEAYREQFRFLRENGIETPEQLAKYRENAEQRLAELTKQRTILNVKKKNQKALFDALATADTLFPAKELYAQGITGIEDEFARYMEAVEAIEKSGGPREQLMKEKTELYEALAGINADMRKLRKEADLCGDVAGVIPGIEKNIQSVSKQNTRSEVKRDEHERR